MSDTRPRPTPNPRRPIGHPDYWLITAVAALVVIGLVMVFSASAVLGANDADINDPSYFFTRQLLWVALGGVAMAVIASLDYRHLRRLAPWGMAGAILLLVAVFVVGSTTYGAARWIRVGGFSLQPSEFAKLAVVVFFAHWLTHKGDHVRHFSYGSTPFAILLAIVCGLIIMQPDMGTMTVVLITAVCLFFLAGANLKHFALGGAAGCAALWGIVQIAPYRLERVWTFLEPDRDPTGSGWHILQSISAVGSGGAFGVGLGKGLQKFYWLFGAHNDAIFAVIAEELGLVGAVLTMVLFGVVAVRGFRIAERAPDRFGGLLAAGVTCLIVFQALINMAVVVGVVPFTGIPLPFISYGGSAVMVMLASVGVMLSVSRQANAEAAADPAATPYAEATFARARKRGFSAARPAIITPISSARQSTGGRSAGRISGEVRR